MKFVIFSDHHAHNFTYGCKEDPYFRFKTSLQALQEIREYVSTRDIDFVCFAGDMYHTRGRVDTVVFNQTFQEISRLAAEVPVYMIPGNHDYADREGTSHSLEPFGEIENVNVFSNPIVHTISGKPFYFVPYIESKDTLLEALTDSRGEDAILIAHCGIQGAKVGANFVLVDDADISYNDLPNTFHACFFGHYHRHQQLGPSAWYVGATHQHNWGDSGCTRGFLEVGVTDETCTIKHVEIESTPKFVRWSTGDPAPRDNDFVRVVSKEEDLADVPGRVVEFMPEKITKVSAKSQEIEEDNFSLPKLVEIWVGKAGIEGDDESRLSKLGKELLAEVL